MKTLARLLALGALLVLSQNSHALACRMDSFDGKVDMYVDLETTVAISKTMPQNTIVWRSPDHTVDLVCWQDGVAYAEPVHFYPSPLDGGTWLGDDLEVGIHVYGEDHLYSQMKPHDRLDLTKYDKGYWLPNCDKWGVGCRQDYQVVRKSLTFNFFFSKKSPPSKDPPPANGKVTEVTNYRVFQLDGAGGLTNKDEGNLRVTVRNMQNLRYINCSSTIALSHPTINFGGINKANAQTGQSAGEKSFSITASKDCDSAYGLGALLTPIAGTTLDASHEHMLVPTDNKSIGITLHDMDNNERLVPINEEFELVKHSTDRTVMRKFLARATWLKEAAQVQLGKFNAGATIDIYYK